MQKFSLEPPRKSPEELYQEKLDLLSHISGTDLITGPIEEIPKLIGEVIPKVGIGFLVGSSDTGKSMFLTQLAISVVSQNSFLGWPVKATHKRAIYVSTEDGADEIKYRMQRMNRDFQLRELAGFRLVTDWPDSLPDKLEAMLEAEAADLVIVDAFGDVFDGKDMNANNQVRSCLQPYNLLAQRHKCCVLFMHHIGKKTEEYQPSKNNLIGSQGIEGKSRFIYELRADKDDWAIRHFCIVKANGLSAEYKNDSYALHFNDNFLFSNTGRRVPFSELKIPRDHKRASLAPEMARNESHMQFLRECFLTNSRIKNSALKVLAKAKLESGEHIVRELVKFWEKKGYIRNCGTPKNIIYELGVLDESPFEPKKLEPIPFANSELPF